MNSKKQTLPCKANYVMCGVLPLLFSLEAASQEMKENICEVEQGDNCSTIALNMMQIKIVHRRSDTGQLNENKTDTKHAMQQQGGGGGTTEKHDEFDSDVKSGSPQEMYHTAAPMTAANPAAAPQPLTLLTMAQNKTRRNNCRDMRVRLDLWTAGTPHSGTRDRIWVRKNGVNSIGPRWGLVPPDIRDDGGWHPGYGWYTEMCDDSFFSIGTSYGDDAYGDDAVLVDRVHLEECADPSCWFSRTTRTFGSNNLIGWCLSDEPEDAEGFGGHAYQEKCCREIRVNPVTGVSYRNPRVNPVTGDSYPGSTEDGYCPTWREWREYTTPRPLSTRLGTPLSHSSAASRSGRRRNR